MWSIATDVACSLVCLSVGQDRYPWKKRLNRSRCHLGCWLKYAQATAYYMVVHMGDPQWIFTTWEAEMSPATSSAHGSRPAFVQTHPSSLMPPLTDFRISALTLPHKTSLEWLFIQPKLQSNTQTQYVWFNNTLHGHFAIRLYITTLN